ncbi:MAG: preprotein translocase subunit YajC [Actinomycetota bacterium]
MDPALAVVAASSNSGSSSTALLVSLGLMVVVFYFLLIRPQQRRARAQRSLVDELGVGDDVVTVGGMFGTIRALDDESVTVEVAAGTQIRMLKSAILRKHVVDEDVDVQDEGADETS